MRLPMTAALLVVLVGQGLLAQEPSRELDLSELLDQTSGEAWHGLYEDGIKTGYVHTRCGLSDEGGVKRRWVSSEAMNPGTFGVPIGVSLQRADFWFDLDPPYELCEMLIRRSEGISLERSFESETIRITREGSKFTLKRVHYGKPAEPKTIPPLIWTYPLAIGYRLLVHSQASNGAQRRFSWPDLGTYLPVVIHSRQLAPYTPSEDTLTLVSRLSDGACDVSDGTKTTRYGPDGWVRHSLAADAKTQSLSGFRAESKALALSPFDAEGAWRSPVEDKGGLSTAGVALGLKLEIKGAIASLAVNSHCQTVRRVALDRVEVSVGTLNTKSASKASRPSPKPEGLQETEVDTTVAKQLVAAAKGKSGEAALRCLHQAMAPFPGIKPSANRGSKETVLSHPLPRARLLAYAGQKLGLPIVIREGFVHSPDQERFTWHAWCEAKLNDHWCIIDPSEPHFPSRRLHLTCRRATRAQIRFLNPDNPQMIAVLEQISVDTGIPDLSLFADGNLIAGFGLTDAEELRGFRKRGFFETLAGSTNDESRSYLFLTPHLLAKLSTYSLADSWTTAELAMMQEIANWIHEVADGPKLRFDAKDPDANRSAIRLAGEWFTEEVKKPDRLASFLFLVKDKPMKGKEYKGDPAELEEASTITPEKGVTLMLAVSLEGEAVLTCRTPSKAWSRIISRPKPQHLPRLQFIPNRTRINSRDCGTLLNIYDGTTISLYCDRDWNFLFFDKR